MVHGIVDSFQITDVSGRSNDERAVAAQRLADRLGPRPEFLSKSKGGTVLAILPRRSDGAAR